MIRKPCYKISRRVGEAIFNKCQNPKFTAGQSSGKGRVQKHRSGTTEYSAQLTEKQKIRFSYGTTEGKLRLIMRKIRREKGLPAELLMRKLELRLDNVIFRAGLAVSRVQARTLATHGHYRVNGKTARIPSQLLRVGDTITVRKESQERSLMKGFPIFVKYAPPKWLSREDNGWSATIRTLPMLADADTTLAWSSVTEFYSRD